MIFSYTGTDLKPQSLNISRPSFNGNFDQWKKYTETDILRVVEAIKSGAISGGTDLVKDFERVWKETFNLPYVVSTSSGTASLLSAYFGIGVTPGTEVICPTYTWISSIAPAVLLGAKPVLCNIDERSLQLDIEEVAQLITRNTIAVVVPHLWGNLCDMYKLQKLCQSKGVYIVEDCSHAHGAQFDGHRAGALGDVACWSLQESKLISAGEGGVLGTKNSSIFEKSAMLGQINRLGTSDIDLSLYPEFAPLGYGVKLRSCPMGIALAFGQLERLSAANEGRRRYVEAIENLARATECIEPTEVLPLVVRGGYYSLPLIYKRGKESGASVEMFVQKLNANEIPASGSFYPLLHLLPQFSLSSLDRAAFANTENTVNNLVFLPVATDADPNLLEAMLQRLYNVCKEE